MVGALLSQAAGKDAEPYLAGGVLGLAGGYAAATLGGRAVNSAESRVRLLRDWRLQPPAVRVLVRPPQRQGPEEPRLRSP